VAVLRTWNIVPQRESMLLLQLVPTRMSHDKAIPCTWHESQTNQETEGKEPPCIGLSASKTVRTMMMANLVNRLD
jgi:hypothetical protein